MDFEPKKDYISRKRLNIKYNKRSKRIWGYNVYSQFDAFKGCLSFRSSVNKKNTFSINNCFSYYDRTGLLMGYESFSCKKVGKKLWSGRIKNYRIDMNTSIPRENGNQYNPLQNNSNYHDDYYGTHNLYDINDLIEYQYRFNHSKIGYSEWKKLIQQNETNIYLDDDLYPMVFPKDKNTCLTIKTKIRISNKNYFLDKSYNLLELKLSSGILKLYFSNQFELIQYFFSISLGFKISDCTDDAHYFNLSKLDTWINSIPVVHGSLSIDDQLLLISQKNSLNNYNYFIIIDLPQFKSFNLQIGRCIRCNILTLTSDSYGCLCKECYYHIDNHVVDKENKVCMICLNEFQKDSWWCNIANNGLNSRSSSSSSSNDNASALTHGICQDCKVSVKQEKLRSCPQCRAPFINNSFEASFVKLNNRTI
jgi:hypothetical protein